MEGGTSKHQVWLNAARKLDAPDWELSVYAAGTCHLTGVNGQAAEVHRPGGHHDKSRRPRTGGARAPRVLGRDLGHRVILVWQYARNGWAEMVLPFYPHNSAKQAAARRDAVKVASQIRYGAATLPLLFPIQLTHLPSRWRVSSVTYVPDAGAPRASSYALARVPPIWR